MTHPRTPVISRFAPSPTGWLHLGHLYAAQFAQDLAANGGTFLLRYEDIDITRVRPQYYRAIEEDLSACQISWAEEPLRQVDRFDAYNEALNTLKKLAVVYPCFCSRKDIQRELSQLTRAPHGPDGPLYPGSCRTLSPSQIQTRLSAGEIPAWRLHSQRAAELTGNLSFHDHFRGDIAVNPNLLGDIILARKDITTSYHIAVVVDDAFQQVSDVSRGEDLLDSTHLHRILQKLLQLPEPRYHHHALVGNSEGIRLAKRDDAQSIRSLLDQGHCIQEITAMIHSRLLPRSE